MRHVPIVVITSLLAAGVALTAAGLSGTDASVSGWVLKYERPTGPFANSEFKLVSDPSPEAEQAMRVTQVAANCRLNSYRVGNNLASTDVNEAVWLEIGQASDAELSCLRRFVVPPYITLEAGKR